jgi:hypothetical protein
MNKGINILLAFFLIPLFALAIVIGFDLNVFGIIEGIETPFISEIYIGAAAFVGILLGIRATQRWMGIRLLQQTSKFIWIKPMSKERISRVRLYLFLENSYLLFIGVYFTLISPYTVVLGWVCIGGFTEALLFFLLRSNTKYMKVGLTKKALIVGDRDVKFYYFVGLRKISVLQDSVYLEYKENLTLSFPINAIEQNEMSNFKTSFLDTINKDKVFVSEKFKEL